MPIANLWPAEIATAGGLEGPVVVLKEQAALLGETTKNLVEAEIGSEPNETNTGFFQDHFIIYSTVINYRYELFSVRYPFDFYPATIYWDGYNEFPDKNGDYNGYKDSIGSRAELEDELRVIFSHPKTVRMIQALIARSRQ